MAMEIRDGPHLSDATLQRGLTPDVIPADRQGAFQLWAYVHGQNAAATARALGLSENTVRSWAARDGWRGRLDLEREEQTQRVRSVAELALIRAVPEVIERLHKIAMVQGDTKPVVLKDGSVVDVEQVIPAQAQVNACNSLLDRFGLTAVRLHQHQVTATTPAPPPTDYTTTAPDPDAPLTSDQILTMTPDQIRQAPQLPPLTREIAVAMTPDQRQAWEIARRQWRAE